MTDIARKFRENPWEDITDDIFPKGKQLYQDDKRFFVSKKEGGKLVFYAYDETDHLPEKELDVSEIKIEFDKLADNKKRISITFEDLPLTTIEQLIIVVKDVAIHCSQFKGSQFFSEIISRFGTWSEFLKPSRRGLKESELIGLWGEMYLVKEYFLKNFTPTQSIDFWVGPERKKQDFTLNNIALEAKTTLSENNSRIKISSLEQLERITSELYLVHIFLNKTNDEQSWTLERLNLAILEAIKDDVILKSSYFRKISKLYNKATLEQLQLKFNFVDKNIYTVIDSFPGIVASEELHPALVKASYELDTNKLSEYKIDKSLNEILKNG